MLKQQARLIARIVYGVDLVLTSVAFLAAFFIRDLILPNVDPQHFPTGLFPLAEYLKIYPLVLIIWSVLLFSYHSYHSHRTIPLTREALTTIRVNAVGIAILATFAYLIPLRQLSRAWFILFVTLAIAGRYVLASFPAGGLMLVRVVGAAAVLLGVLALRGGPWVRDRRDLVTLLLLGLVGIAANQGLFVARLSRTTATSATILVTTVPVFTVLGSVLTRREPPSKARNTSPIGSATCGTSSA